MNTVIRIFSLAFLMTGSICLQAAEPVDPETLPGTWIERDDGRFLRLVIEENQVELHFYDKTKQVEKPDPLRATIRFRHPVRAPETLTLIPDRSKPFLTHPRYIRPPFTFHTIVMLIFEEDAEPAESYPLFFRQEITPESSRVTGEQRTVPNS